MPSMDTSALKNLGLTNREIEVYIKLVEKGESSAADLAKNSTISRTHVYEALKTLIIIPRPRNFQLLLLPRSIRYPDT